MENGLDFIWNCAWSDAKEFGQRFTIRQQPGFDFAYSDTKNEIAMVLAGQPFLHQSRGAFAIVKISQNRSN